LRPLIALLLAAAAALLPPPATEQHLASPDGRLEVVVWARDRLGYDVLYQGKPMLAACELSLAVDGVRLGVSPQLVRVERRAVDARVDPPVRLAAATLVDRYHELRLEFAGGYAVVFRAYDEGVAYRFETALPAAEVKVGDEQALFRFAADAEVIYPHEEGGFMSHNEPAWKRLPLSRIAPAMLATLPAVVATPAGPKVAIAEADLESYPGLWLRGTSGPALAATFPPYPLETRALRDRDIKVVRAADYLAVTRGTRTYPWRVLAVAPHDADLVANPLCYLLQRPSEIGDASWIRPGKVAWDWWNDRNLRGVKFKPGINTDTYRYYIDFAAKNGIEYVILDEGWYETGNLSRVVPRLDMPALLAYARAKNVEVILWVVWKTFADQMEPALAQFERWGIKGLKIDFMQRDDQPVIDFYWRTARALAARHMLVDFHGAVRPALMTRTFPNIVSAEGVKGLEHDKWSNLSDPEHTTTLPFTRMLLGPMDYTPGAMLNADKAHFKIDFHRPMSLGTRCHQLAMYVVFTSPLQMLADSPTNYEAEPEAMELLRAVPTVWDETRVLEGRIGDYVVVARRRGSRWFVGAMTDWSARDLEVDLAFLGGGAAAQLGWDMVSFSDVVGGPAQSARRATALVTRATRLPLRLGPGGGFAAVLTPRVQAPARVPQ
jgi:alpha-glucosidase